MKNTKIYLGPPGTGKTHTLMNILESEFKNVHPRKIAYLSFTKKAVDEAIKRAKERFPNLKPADTFYFKTVHALGFSQIGMKAEQIINENDFNKIGEHLNIEFSFDDTELPDWNNIGKNPRGDFFLYLYRYARSRKMKSQDAWYMLKPQGLFLGEYERFERTLEEYKQKFNKIDFTDMLEIRHQPFDVDVLIIDEAQDLSTAQWHYLEHAFTNVKRTYICGDDDQAIYEWSGADVNYFINLEGERIMLSQSHRIPQEIFKVARNIVKKMSNRAQKSYAPTTELGSVNRWFNLNHIDISKGSWLLLGRDNRHLKKLKEFAIESGCNFKFKYTPIVPKKDIKAILAWERHRKGEALTPAETLLLGSYTSSLNKTCIWHDAFNLLSESRRELYISMLRRGENLHLPPRVTINTIHGVKGGEADNVLLLTDMSFPSWNTMRINPDSEHRVWYVGVTRAKSNLHIVLAKGKYKYLI